MVCSNSSVGPADWHICKYWLFFCFFFAFFLLFYFPSKAERKTFLVMLHLKISWGQQRSCALLFVLYIGFWDTNLCIFFSIWSFLPSAFSCTGATCCLEAISYISFGPFHHSLLCIKGHRLITLLGTWQTPPSLFFSSSDIKLVFYSCGENASYRYPKRGQ